jgi:hypothetical protein
VSKTTSKSLYLTVAEAVAVLGDDGERLLIQARVDGKAPLTGRQRSSRGLGERRAIPKTFFADSVRLDPIDNSTVPDATADFAAFEQSSLLRQWEEIRVAAADVSCLVASKSGTGAVEKRLAPAIKARIDGGQRPGDTEPWKTFCDGVRNDCNGWKAPNKPRYGFGDKTIQRRAQKYK